VPRNRILSTAATGLGAMPENEVVVLGGKYPALAVTVDRSYLFSRDASKAMPETPDAFFKRATGDKW
jgi:hypothetical protein